jgi:hypothetical protein
MKVAATILCLLNSGPSVADQARFGPECPVVPFGTPYTLTEADWASIPVETINAREDSDLRDGVIDLTQPDEPMVYQKYTLQEFREVIPGDTNAFSFDANADGLNEIYIEFDKVTTCSNGVAQCLFLVMDSSSPRRPLLAALGHCIAAGDAGQNGWQDIVITGTDDDYIVRSRTYQFDGAHYSNPVTRIIRPFVLEK